MNDKEGFYTLKGYQISEETTFTTAMEDYLEMVCRVLQENETVKVGGLSRILHVKPSSVSKMVSQLKDSGYLHAQKYGVISLTDKGRLMGEYLLYRHEVIQRFLCTLNNSEDELEQTEKIEHFLDPVTVINLDELTRRLRT
ncbi:metal-dependent transcriptional regulator [Blautia schinkii]|nr:metal-dependent transcriptional regulator [Blautia schinkii]